MTHEEFQSRYKLLQRITDGSVETHHAVAPTGAIVMVHFVADIESREVLSLLERLEPTERSRVLEVVDVDDRIAVVTRFIMDFSSLRAWLQGGAVAGASPAADGPDTSPPAEAPGEFTRLFRAPPIDEAPATVPRQGVPPFDAPGDEMTTGTRDRPASPGESQNEAVANEAVPAPIPSERSVEATALPPDRTTEADVLEPPPAPEPAVEPEDDFASFFAIQRPEVAGPDPEAGTDEGAPYAATRDLPGSGPEGDGTVEGGNQPDEGEAALEPAPPTPAPTTGSGRPDDAETARPAHAGDQGAAAPAERPPEPQSTEHDAVAPTGDFTRLFRAASVTAESSTSAAGPTRPARTTASTPSPEVVRPPAASHSVPLPEPAPGRATPSDGSPPSTPEPAPGELSQLFQSMQKTERPPDGGAQPPTPQDTSPFAPPPQMPREAGVDYGESYLDRLQRAAPSGESTPSPDASSERTPPPPADGLVWDGYAFPSDDPPPPPPPPSGPSEYTRVISAIPPPGQEPPQHDPMAPAATASTSPEALSAEVNAPSRLPLLVGLGLVLIAAAVLVLYFVLRSG
jgi:hypothetical protein